MTFYDNAFDPHEAYKVGWYFWDETGANAYGPYSTKEEADAEKKRYAETLNPPAYNRMYQWELFSDQVKKHIEYYTLPQYGNPSGNEQIDTFTIEDCFQNMLRYINRRHALVRGKKEALRDVIKIAHYANFIYDKMKKELEEEDVY